VKFKAVVQCEQGHVTTARIDEFGIVRLPADCPYQGCGAEDPRASIPLELGPEPKMTWAERRRLRRDLRSL
jgi:hypothetical protein